MDSNECAMKRDPDDAEVLMDPLFVPVKVEHDFEGSSEETIMEENLEATENAEDNDSSEYAVKREIDDAEVLMAPLFVPVKTEPEFESGSEETVVEEKFEGNEITEDFSKKGDQQPHIKYPTLPCYSQIASSTTQFHSKMVVMNTQKHFCKNSLSCQPGTFLQSLLSQEPCAISSCSTTGDPVEHEDAIVRYVRETYGEEQVTGEREKQHSDQSESMGCADKPKIYFERKTMSFSALRTSGEKSKRGPFRCATCEKICPNKSNYVRHMRTHTGERPFICSQCGVSFTQKNNLSAHIKIHTGEKPFKCKECGRAFKLHNQLIMHMRTHTGEKPYKCSQCEKSFSNRSNYILHMRSHTGEKPYRCSHCGRSFSQSSVLTNHMRTHTGHRPYKCLQCGDCFTQSGTLTSHMRTHNRDQPYKCSQCGKSFRTSGALSRHMGTHFADQPSRCLQNE